MPLQAGRDKVSIVGFCESSRGLTPWHDPTHEVWQLNRAAIFAQPSPSRIVPGAIADRWFEMHGRDIFASQDRRPGKHEEFLRDFPGPVYLHKADPALPNAIEFPLKELADEFGANLFRRSVNPQTPDKIVDTKNAPYLSSSIAYEIALAIYEGFKEIHLYGVDLNTESEYAWQKPGVEYLLGVAVGRGIKVVLPDNCPLLKGTLYGRGFMKTEVGPLMSYDQLTARRKSIELELQQMNQELQRVIGARVELEHLMSQMVPGLDHEQCDQRRQKMAAHEGQIGNKLLQVQGAMKETTYWLHQTYAGQEPTDAIAQLTAVDEGPQTEIEAMQTFPPDAVVYESPISNISNINGHQAPELVPAGV